MRKYENFNETKLKTYCQASDHEVRMISRELCALWHRAEQQDSLNPLRTKYAQKQFYEVSKIRLTERSKWKSCFNAFISQQSIPYKAIYRDYYLRLWCLHEESGWDGLPLLINLLYSCNLTQSLTLISTKTKLSSQGFKTTSRTEAPSLTLNALSRISREVK